MDSRSKEQREHEEALRSKDKATRRAAQEKGFIAWFKSVFGTGPSAAARRAPAP